MQIGLIGGIGPAATDYYYRRLIQAFAETGEDLDMTIVHADTSTLLGNQAQGNIDAQVAIYDRLTERLVSAGAGCVAVTSIAGHFCIDAFKKSSPLPVIDMLLEVRAAIDARRLKRIGILGTRTVMETRFYGAVHTAEAIPPHGDALGDVHDAYVAMAAAGKVTDDQRAVFDAACGQLIEESGVEAIMLGGTDLALVYREEGSAFPVLDCAAVHVDAIVRTVVGP
jgi:aspartate racemase